MSARHSTRRITPPHRVDLGHHTSTASCLCCSFIFLIMQRIFFCFHLGNLFISILIIFFCSRVKCPTSGIPRPLPIFPVFYTFYHFCSFLEDENSFLTPSFRIVKTLQPPAERPSLYLSAPTMRDFSIQIPHTSAKVAETLRYPVCVRLFSLFKAHRDTKPVLSGNSEARPQEQERLGRCKLSMNGGVLPLGSDNSLCAAKRSLILPPVNESGQLSQWPIYGPRDRGGSTMAPGFCLK